MKRTFERIFDREKITAAYIEGDAFHRYNRKEMKRVMKAEAKKGNPHFSHFGPEANLLEDLEAVFQDFGESGTSRTRHYGCDEEEEQRYSAGQVLFYGLGRYSAGHRSAVLRRPARCGGPPTR